MPDDGAQDIGLVIGTERRKFAAHHRGGTVAAAAEIVDAQNPVASRVHAETRTDELRPPSFAPGACANAVSRNTAEHGNHRPVGGTPQPARQLRTRPRVARMPAMG